MECTHFIQKNGTKKERFVKGVVSGALTVAGSSLGNGITKPFGEKAALDFVMAHVITDVNVGSATTIISEACQSMVSERVASAVFNHAKMMGKRFINWRQLHEMAALVWRG